MCVRYFLHGARLRSNSDITDYLKKVPIIANDYTIKVDNYELFYDKRGYTMGTFVFIYEGVYTHFIKIK